MKLVVNFVKIVSLSIFPPNENYMHIIRDDGLYNDAKEQWFVASGTGHVFLNAKSIQKICRVKLLELGGESQRGIGAECRMTALLLRGHDSASLGEMEL